MNLSVAVLLVVLSGEGYWFGGHTEMIQFHWNVKEPTSPAAITWRLACGDARLASGRIALPAKDRTAKVQLKVPEVRVPTQMQFIYRAEQAGQPKPIAEGVVTVEVYPDNLLATVAERMKGKKVFVWDDAAGLPALFKSHGAQSVHVRSEADLQFVLPDLLIVAADQLGREVREQEKPLNLVVAGTSVLVLRQTKPATLAGYRLAQRSAPPKLAWLADHPLTRSLHLFAISSLGTDAWTIRLPADEPALEIGWCANVSPGRMPAPIDALVVVKAVGKGRIVLCQVPLGPWESDPRSQLFLAGALDYLVSPVVPTPAPSRRLPPAEPAAAPEVPTIHIP